MCGGFVGSLLGTLTGGLIGDSGSSTVQMPEAPDIKVEEKTLNPEQITLTEENTAQSQLDSVQERNKRRGQSSTILTSGAGVGTGTTSKKNSLGG